MIIYEALRKDHDKVKELLNELIMLNDHDEHRNELINQIHDELIPHARAEESVFYNSLRSIDAAKDIIMHGYEEHIEVETMLRSLQLKDVIDADWKATAKKLKKTLEHHIQEEEGKIFNVAQQLLTRDEAEMLGEAFEQLKPEVQRDGFVKSTLDMLVNLMPPRFAATLRTINLKPGQVHTEKR